LLHIKHNQAPGYFVQSINSALDSNTS